MTKEALSTKFKNISLSNEYLIYSIVILSSIFIVSAFFYCYSYSVHINNQNEKLKEAAIILEQRLGRALDEKTELKEDRTLKKLEEANGIGYIVVDDNCRIIYKSSQVGSHLNTNICAHTSIDSLIGTRGSSGQLSQALVEDAISFSFYRKVKGHSHTLTILTGYDKNILEQALHEQVMPRLWGLAFMGFFCTVLLYFFRRKIITPITTLSDCATKISEGKPNVKIPRQGSTEMLNLAKALILVKHYIRKKEIYRKQLELANEIVRTSTEAREHFIKSLNKELMYPLKEILINTEILLKHILENNKGSSTTQLAIKSIEKIRDATISIKTKTTGSLNLSTFDFANIVNQAVKINLKQSFDKNIAIKTQLTEQELQIYGDALKLKQILVCLIAQALENSSEAQEVNILVDTLEKEEQSFIQVIIKDNGFGLSEMEMLRIQSNVGWCDETNIFTNLEHTSIEKIVNMHNGTFYTENKIHEGRTVHLLLPLLNEADFTKDKEDNILYLHSKLSS